METISKIERLQKLLSSGAITQEEFDTQKQKVLGNKTLEKVPKGLGEKEKTYFKENGIHITNTRAIFPTKTYAMANITSVSVGKKDPNRIPPIVLIIIGLIFLSFGSNIGAIIILGGIVWLYYQKNEYSVKIGSASGEIDGLTSKKHQLIKKVVSAMNDAIIDRG